MNAAKSITRLFAPAALLFFVAAAPAPDANGQPARLVDRRALLGPNDHTADDVQRALMPADYNAPQGSFVLLGGRLFDGTGKPARSATIVVTRKTITAILAPGDRTWSADAKVYDITGKTVMPGLIDLHTHLSYVEPNPGELADSEADATLRALDRMRIFAESGISSVRDVASNGAVPFVLKDWQSKGRILGPRVFPAGQLITGTGGHGASAYLTSNDPSKGAVREASGPEGFRDAVRIQFKQGADIIKLASHYSQAEIDAAVDEAHMLGLPVTVDSENQYITMAIKAGVDCIEHPLGRTDADIAEMARKHICSDITIIPYHIIMAQRGGYWGSSSRRFSLNDDTTMAMFRKIKAAGVKMGIGTDLVWDWVKFMPDAYIQELKYFMAVGYTAPQVLVGATRTNAEILHMVDKLGTVETGKLADLLVIDGKPDERIDDLHKVSLLFVNGRLTVRDGVALTPELETTKLP